MRGVTVDIDEQLLVEGALIELRLVGLGFSLSDIREMSQQQVELYLGAIIATEEKEAQDRQNAERSARMKHR